MGNACSSGAVNAPKRRGRKPLPPIRGRCLQCGADFTVSRRGNRKKKFCGLHCATTFNMAVKFDALDTKRDAIEQCLCCHDKLLMKQQMSANAVAEKKSYIAWRRRRSGFDWRKVSSMASRAFHASKEAMRGQTRQERHLEYRAKQEQKIAWAQEWRGVIDCWQAWQIERKAKNRAKGYAWQTLKRATDWEWRERTRIRMKCNGIKKAKPHSNKYIIELGCSYWQAKKHIERQWLPGMSWDNHGTAWEIDHIVPASRFDVNDPMQRLQMCHFTNLQPMWTRDNRRKLNRVEPRSSLQLVML